MVRLISRLAINLLLLISVPAFAGVGSISEFQGGGSVKRGAKVAPAAKGSSIEKNDTVSTNSQGRFKIRFVDATTVNITQNSRLVIDDFVYDGNNKSKGKLGLKLALGTARYTSGGIAHGNARGVGIRTPTATIAVRGTDFVMSVDEAAPPVVINPAMKGMDNNIQISPLETDDGQSLINAARESLKKFVNPAKAASDDNQDPNTGGDGVEEVAVATLRLPTQDELQNIYAEYNSGARPTETIYTNVSPTFKKQLQVGWVYSRISEDKNQSVIVWLPKDTEIQLVSVQNGIVDAYNFMDDKWTTTGTGRPQGNITVIQESGAR